MKDIVIIGSGGCAKEIVFLVEENNKIKKEFHILGFIDTMGGEILGYPVLGDDEWLKSYKQPVCAVCGINSPSKREEIIRKYKNCSNITFPTLISHHALIGEHNQIGEGSILCARTTITTNVKIGQYVIVNIGSTISHDSVIGDFTSINPGVNVSGNVIVGEKTEIGVGAKIIPGIQIGKRAVVGAGAVVIRNVEDECTMAGVPAKKIVGKE